MPFRPYRHIERLGTDETEGILEGICFLFPKLDGTNASIWYEDGAVHCGSRKRELSLGSDNAGFMSWVYTFLGDRPWATLGSGVHIYGEWLVPHTYTGYRDEAWRNFYVFDITVDDRYQDYETVQAYCSQLSLSYIPALAVIGNPNDEALLRTLGQNYYLCDNGKGPGEGIVIKNYGFVNKYGRHTAAKLVRNEFKDQHLHKDGPPRHDLVSREAELVEKYLPVELPLKTMAKIAEEKGGWSSKNIPELLGRVYHDFIVEEGWQIAKENMTVDFKRLQQAVIRRTKELTPEVF